MATGSPTVDNAPTHSWRNSTLAWLGLTLVLIAAFSAQWIFQAVPYRMFPSDDGMYFASARSPLDDPSCRAHQFFVGLTLCAFGKIYQQFTPLTMSVLPVLGVVCYAATMFLLSLMAYRATRSLIASGLAMVLFGTSAWPATYLQFWFCAPITVAVGTLCLFCIVEASRRGGAGRLWALAAGLTAGMCLACEVAASIYVALCVALMCLACWPLSKRGGQLTLVVFLGGLLIGYLLFMRGHEGDWLRHVAHNLTSDHPTDAQAKFHFVPKPPRWVALWILWRYSLVLPVALVLASAAYLWHIGRGRMFNRATRPAALSAADKLLGFTGLLVWSYFLVVDCLPTSKLGRAHFLVYPAVCLFLGVAAQQATGWLRPGWRRYYFAAVALAVIVCAVQGIDTSWDMSARRQSLPRYLAKTLGAMELFLLREDPHANYLKLWLSTDRDCTVIAAADFNAARRRLHNQAALLLGPSGVDSGNSILRHGCNPDFNLEGVGLVRPAGATVTAFPYYAYCPPFCLEEENCQGLLYAGMIPVDSDAANDVTKGATLLTWPSGAP
ncbi:MAG: hypothetical protein K8T25_15605 [Planctomycetia bacterium]|nr:hypothetical protein [Planctomycetia bacterium]